jgi:hypothetical protein
LTGGKLNLFPDTFFSKRWRAAGPGSDPTAAAIWRGPVPTETCQTNSNIATNHLHLHPFGVPQCIHYHLKQCDAGETFGGLMPAQDVTEVKSARKGIADFAGFEQVEQGTGDPRRSPVGKMQTKEVKPWRLWPEARFARSSPTR